MPSTQKHRLLAIGTALADEALLLTRFSITEQLGRLFQIDLDLLSSDTSIDFDKIIGTNATVRLEMQNGKTRYFNGYVSRFAHVGEQGNFGRYRATLVPWLWFLTRTSDCRIFQKKKVPDIVEEVFKGHGLKEYKLRLSGSYQEWEYCVQYRETDFNFVSRLMEQEGIYYYFTHENGKHTLVLADSISSHDPFPGYETLSFRPPVQQRGDQNEETITEWAVEKEIQPGVYALADFNFKNPASPIVANANISRKHEAAAFEMFDYPGEYDDEASGKAYAKVRIQELQTQHELLRGQGTSRGLGAGNKFTLKDHPRKDQNREYLIVSSSCHAGTSEFDTSGTSGQDEFFSCSLSAIPASEPYRSPRTTPKPLIQGPQTAFVVGKSGEEIDTDEFGRVKVQFHWDRYGKVDENSSCWVRVSHPWAGKGWGAISLPRIGQEVVVEFLEGDPDQPIITGRVYNGTAKPPHPLPDNKTISTLKTSSSKGSSGFNEIRFEDKKGDEQIFMHGEKNVDIRIKNDEYEWVGNDRHLIVKKDQVEQVENDRQEKIKRDHIEEIGRDHHLKIAGKEAIKITGAHSITVEDDVIEVFKKNQSTQVTKDLYIKGENIIIEASTNVTINVGESYIAIQSSGIKIATSGKIMLVAQDSASVEGTSGVEVKSDTRATVQSLNTTIKGDATVKVDGGGMTEIKGGMVKIN